MATSTDGCQTFPFVANASPVGANFTDLQDKPWMAVDNTGGPHDGNIHVCWTRLKNSLTGFTTGADLRFSRSIDGGATFQDEQTISGPDEVLPLVPLGCSVDVGPGGEVYVSWGLTNYLGFSASLRFRRSVDGGLTWDLFTQVNSQADRAPGADRIVGCGEAFPRTTLNGDIRQLYQSWMAVDRTGGPYDGRMYLVWASDPIGTVDNSDVYFSYSTDRGQTWQPQVQLAGGTVTDQFEPFVEVGGDGTVSIAWYDRRNDPASNYYIDVYATFSRDGGATIDPLVRISDVSFPPITFSCYMGEYIAVAADGSNFYYLWGDNRNGDPDVYFDRMAVPAVLPPTPTPTATPTLTPTVTPRPVGGISIDPGADGGGAASSRAGSAIVRGTIIASTVVGVAVAAAWLSLARRRAVD